MSKEHLVLTSRKVTAGAGVTEAWRYEEPSGIEVVTYDKGKFHHATIPWRLVRESLARFDKDDKESS